MCPLTKVWRLPTTRDPHLRGAAAPIGGYLEHAHCEDPPLIRLHSYVILLYSQPQSFGAPDGLDYEGAGVSVFNLTDYVLVSLALRGRAYRWLKLTAPLEQQPRSSCCSMLTSSSTPHVCDEADN